MVGALFHHAVIYRSALNLACLGDTHKKRIINPYLAAEGKISMFHWLYQSISGEQASKCGGARSWVKRLFCFTLNSAFWAFFCVAVFPRLVAV